MIYCGLRNNKTLVVFILTLLFSVNTDAAAKLSTNCNNQRLVAHAVKQGYTWTFTSKLGQILQDAEQHYGKRDHSWTLLGIEFSSDHQPKVWYPYSKDNEKFIIIQLTQKAYCQEKIAIYQIAHEVIHLLSPLGAGQKSNVLEEGLATYFAIKQLEKHHYSQPEGFIATRYYRHAYDVVQQLYAVYPDTDQKIRRLRQEFTHFSVLTPKQLQQAYPKLAPQLVSRLLSQEKDIPSIN
jgi:hypothetical protein